MESLYHGFRDAIHVPYVVLKATGPLLPGAKLSLRSNHDGQYVPNYVPWNATDETPWHGIADPFIEKMHIETGELFRMLIRKECFSSLRHEFKIEVHDEGGTSTCHSVCDVN